MKAREGAMETDLLLAILSGQTLEGRPILREGKRAANWIRVVLDETNSRLGEHAGNSDFFEARSNELKLIADALSVEVTSSALYDGNRPGYFDSIGLQQLPNAEFTAYDLLIFSATKGDGFRRLLRQCGLPPTTPAVDLFCVAGLLLIEQSVRAIESRRFTLAGYLAVHANYCAEQISVYEWARHTGLSIKELISAKARIGGEASGKGRGETARAPAEKVLKLWDSTMADGASRSEATAAMATRFNVTPGHIRRLVRERR